MTLSPKAKAHRDAQSDWTNGSKQWPDYDCSVHKDAFNAGFDSGYEFARKEIFKMLSKAEIVRIFKNKDQPQPEVTEGE